MPKTGSQISGAGLQNLADYARFMKPCYAPMLNPSISRFAAGMAGTTIRSPEQLKML